MIQYNPKNWYALIFHSYSRFVLKTMMPALIGMTIFTTAVCFIILDVFGFDHTHFQNTTALHSLLGIVLGLFLVFRTNSAYDRWWEGRKLWGSMVNSTRNYALKLGAYMDVNDRENREWFSQMIPNFVIATKEHLRQGVKLNELDIPNDQDAAKIEKASHKPNIISSMLFARVSAMCQQKKITNEQFWLLDKEMKDFIDIMGACERIKYTPIPYSYSMFIKKFIFIYVVTLPFGFVTTFEYITVPTVLLITFVLLSVELIAEEIEDPFGRDINDLPTDDLAVKIKNNVKEILL
jgi:ion channel-forming bestrophin family protein